MSLSFIDTNIFMYAIGVSHSCKEPCERLVQRILEGEVEGIINTEVLQEILYRYSSIGKHKIGYQLFDTLIDTFPMIWPVEKEDVVIARQLQQKSDIKTRDAIHVATMKRNDVNILYSYDKDFDRIAGIKRLEP